MATKSSVELRLFFGLPYTKALQVELSQSANWKRDMLAVKKPLQQVRIKEVDFLGVYLEKTTSIKHLQTRQKEIYAALHSYCPHFRYESLPCSLTPLQLLL